MAKNAGEETSLVRMKGGMETGIMELTPRQTNTAT